MSLGLRARDLGCPDEEVFIDFVVVVVVVYVGGIVGKSSFVFKVMKLFGKLWGSSSFLLGVYG